MINFKNMEKTNEQNVRSNNLISLRKETVQFFHFDNEPTALTLSTGLWRFYHYYCETHKSEIFTEC